MDDLDLPSLDLARVVNAKDLAACLRRLHIKADKPSYRTLQRETTVKPGLLPGTSLKYTALRRNKVSQMLRGEIFPNKAFMLTFVAACGIDLALHPEWARAWERVALAPERESELRDDDKSPSGTPAVVSERSPNVAPGQLSASDEESKNAANGSTSGSRNGSSHDRHVYRSARDPSELAGMAAALAITDPEAAEELAASISETRWKAAAITNVAATVAISDPVRAERLANSINDTGYRACARAIVATTLAAVDPDRAERLAQSFADKTQKAILLATLAGIIAVKDTVQAVRIADSITDEAWKVAAIANIAGMLATTDTERAKRLISSANKIAQGITDDRRKLWALNYIASRLQTPG